jgi:hypothetical protein
MELGPSITFPEASAKPAISREPGRCTAFAEPCPAQETLLNATALWLLLPQLALAYVLHSLNSLRIPELSLVRHFQQDTVHLLILFI